MTIIDSNNGRCPFCDSRAFVVVTWNDEVDATRNIELRVTLGCYNRNCTGFTFVRRVTGKEVDLVCKKMRFPDLEEKK